MTILTRSVSSQPSRLILLIYIYTLGANAFVQMSDDR